MARINGMDPMERVQILLDDYAASGGNVFELKKGNPIYQKVKDAHVVVNGKKLTLHEKFVLAGYDKRVKKAKTIPEITAMLDEFVANGGDVNDLSSTDELYRLVKNIDKKMSLYEKFALCKHPREKKKSEDVFVDLKNEILDYLSNGGSLHVERKTLPFYEKMHSAKKNIQRKTGQEISTKELFNMLGIKGYSDTYYNYLPIFDFEKFIDENGFADSYRSNASMNTFVDQEAEKLGVPISIFVLLIADQNLKKCLLQTDTLSFTSKQLKEYKEKYGSYDGIARNDKNLFNRLCSLKKTVVSDDGKPVSTKELVGMLDADDETGVFKPYTAAEELNFERDVEPLVEIARNNNNRLSTRDIDIKTYRLLTSYASRNNITIKAIFSDFGVEYVDFKGTNSHSHLFVDKYPFIEEMRKDRDSLQILSRKSRSC